MCSTQRRWLLGQVPGSRTSGVYLSPLTSLYRRLGSMLIFLHLSLICVLPPFFMQTVHRWPLFIPSPIRNLKGQRERDCGKNSPVGVC